MNLSQEIINIKLDSENSKQAFSFFSDTDETSNIIKMFNKYKERATTIVENSDLKDYEFQLVNVDTNYRKRLTGAGAFLKDNSMFDSNGSNMIMIRHKKNVSKGSYKTLALASHGDQLGLFEVQTNGKNIQKILQPITVFNKPDSNVMVYKNINGVDKLLQKVNNYNEHGIKTVMNHDYYSLVKNMVQAGASDREGKLFEFQEGIGHIKRVISANTKNISARATESIFASQAINTGFGIGQRSYYNDLSGDVSFSKEMISPYLEDSKIIKKLVRNQITENEYSFQGDIAEHLKKIILIKDNKIHDKVLHNISKNFSMNNVEISNDTTAYFQVSYKELMADYIKEYRRISKDDSFDIFSFGMKIANDEINNLKVNTTKGFSFTLNSKEAFRSAGINTQMIKEKIAYKNNAVRELFDVSDTFQLDESKSFLTSLAKKGIINPKETEGSILKTANQVIKYYKTIESERDDFVKQINVLETKRNAINSIIDKEKRKGLAINTKSLENLKQLMFDKNDEIDKLNNQLSEKKYVNIDERKRNVMSFMSKVMKNEYEKIILNSEGIESIEEFKKLQPVNRISGIANEKIGIISKALNAYDEDYITDIMSRGILFDKYLTVAKQSANTQGMTQNISSSIGDIGGSLNVFGQRHFQGGDKLSSAVVTTATGDAINFAEDVNNWDVTNKFLNFKVENENAKLLMEMHKNVYGNQSPQFLYNKLSPIIYTESNLAFQDSDLISTMLAMKNTSMFENKTFEIPYEALSDSLFTNNGQKMTAEEFRNIFREKGKFQFSNIVNEDSFEHNFMKQLFGEENFEKIKKASFNQNADGTYTVRNIAEEFRNIGSVFEGIGDLSQPSNREKYVLAADKAVQKYNQFLDDFFIRSDMSGRGINIINPKAVNSGQKISISGANYGAIEGIEATSSGIRIKSKGLLIQSEGSKLMLDNIKATSGNFAHLFGIRVGKDFFRADAMVNEKMTKNKRGFNGTFYGRSILTMAMHALNSPIEGETTIDYSSRFNNFMNTMSNATRKDYGTGKTADIFELLGISLSYNSTNNTLSIGETALTGNNRSKIVNMTKNLGELESAQNFLIEQMNNRLNSVFGHNMTDSEATILGQNIFETLYQGYDTFRNTLTKEAQSKSRIFIPAEGAVLEKSFLYKDGNTMKAGTKAVHNIGEQGAFLFFSFPHMMSEAKARNTDDAVKMTRLSNIVLTESGYSWLSEELNKSIVSKNTSAVMENILLTPNNYDSLQPGKKIYNEFFNTSIDLANDTKEAVDTNQPLHSFLRKSTLGQYISFDDGERMSQPLRAVLKNFDPEFLNQNKKMFDAINSKMLDKATLEFAIKTTFDEKFITRLGYKTGEKVKAVEEAKKLAEKYLDQHRKDFLQAFSDYNEPSGKWFNSFLDYAYKGLKNKSFTEKQEDKLRNIENFRKTLVSFQKNDFDPKRLRKAKYRFDKNDISKLTESVKGSDAELLISSANIFSGNNLYGLKSLQQTINYNSLGFVINNIDMDQFGVIVPDRELSRINSIINYQKELKKITDIEKLDIFKNMKMSDAEIISYYQNPEMFKKVSRYLKDSEKVNFMRKNKVFLNNISISEEQILRLKNILGIDNSEHIFMFESAELANKYKSFSGKEAFVSSIHGDLIKSLNASYSQSLSLSSVTDRMLERIDETQRTIKGVTDRQSEYEALENLKEKLHLFASEIYDEQIRNIVSNEQGAKDFHNFIKINLFDKIPENKKQIIDNMNKTIMKSKTPSSIIDNISSIRIAKSAAISPREGSSITDFIRNEAEEIFKLSNNNNMSKEHARKKKEFLQAINLIYGEYYIHDIEKKLNVGDVSGIKNQLDNLSGIVLGEKRHYKQIGFNDLFITNDIDAKGQLKKINKRVTYIDLLRNPHQYIGSIKPTRAVYLTEEDKKLSFLKYFLGDETKVNQGQSNIMLIGKKTALAANGDFDGDVFHLMKYTAEDFAHITDPIEKKTILKKLDLTRELYYILNDHSGKGYDLESIFNDPDFLKKHTNDQYSKMYHLMQSLSGIEENNYKLTPNEAFKKLEKQYRILKFENMRISEAMADESSQHANLPTLGKKLSAIIKNKNQGKEVKVALDQKEFGDFVLGLSMQEKKHIFFSSVNEDNIDTVDKFFDTTNMGKEVKRKLKDFKKLTKAEKIDTFYDFFDQLFRDNKGILKFNHLRLEESGFEAYTGISRTGMIHTTLTSIREANSFVNQTEEYNEYIKRLVNSTNIKNGKPLSTHDIEVLERIKKFSGSFASFNTLGTMIEKLSISSKLGGKVDPYISGANITKFNNLVKNYTEIDNIINFDAIEELSNVLVKNMEDSSLVFKDKRVNSINDLVNIFVKNSFSGDRNKNKKNQIKKSLARVFGTLFEVDIKRDNFDFRELNLSNNKVLAAVANAASVITKGTIENITGNPEIVNGLNNVVNKKEDNLAVIMNEYLRDVSNAGDINQKTAIRHRYIEQIKNLGIEKPIVGTENVANIQTTDSKLGSAKQNATKAKRALQKSEINNAVNASHASNNASDFDSNVNTNKKAKKRLNKATANIYADEIETVKLNVSNLENEKKGLITEVEKLKTQLNDLTANIVGNSKEIDPKLSKHTEEISENIKEHFNTIIRGLENNIVELNKTIDANKTIIESMEAEINSYKQKVDFLSKAKNIAEEKVKTFINAGAKVARNQTGQADSSEESIEVLKSFASKHKKLGITMGTAAVLGMFFRIFQSNRPVVDLSIDEKEYEKSQGSIYRSLGNYNIQTNIRSFY